MICERLDKVSYNSQTKRSTYKFLCCICGSIFHSRSDSKPRSCGCIAKSISIINKSMPESSKWTILGSITNQTTKVLARCSCGYEAYVYPDSILTGHSLGCRKCYANSKIKGCNEIGGIRNHTLYNTLDGMKQRCYNENSASYKHYGGRGITICDEWLDDYHIFIQWGISNGWEEGLTIERIDVNGDYAPSNCTFIAKNLQSRNTRLTKLDEHTVAGIRAGNIIFEDTSVCKEHFNRVVSGKFWEGC